MSNRLLPALAALLALGACVTREPEPCTPEWIDYKTERALKAFASANRGEVARLKSFGAALQADTFSPFDALRMPAMIADFQTLAESFEATALPELNAAISQCASAQALVPAFSAFLRDEGVSEDILEWVDYLGAFVVDAET